MKKIIPFVLMFLFLFTIKNNAFFKNATIKDVAPYTGDQTYKITCGDYFATLSKIGPFFSVVRWPDKNNSKTMEILEKFIDPSIQRAKMLLYEFYLEDDKTISPERKEKFQKLILELKIQGQEVLYIRERARKKYRDVIINFE